MIPAKWFAAKAVAGDGLLEKDGTLRTSPISASSQSAAAAPSPSAAASIAYVAAPEPAPPRPASRSRSPRRCEVSPPSAASAKAPASSPSAASANAPLVDKTKKPKLIYKFKKLRANS